MAKFYDTKTGDILWSDNDVFLPAEHAYNELSDFLATKKLDGHDRRDQWYMLVHQKLGELVDVLYRNPVELDLISKQELL